MATCAYLDYYSTETRMYSWLVLAAILAVACFVLAYRGAGRVYWVAAVLLMVAVLYLPVLRPLLASGNRDRRGGGRRCGAAPGSVSGPLSCTWPVCGAAFAPWAPQFLYQLRNTGAPWAPKPSFLDFFGDSFNALASAAWATIIVAIAVRPHAAPPSEGPWPAGRRRLQHPDGRGRPGATMDGHNVAPGRVARVLLLLPWPRRSPW